MAETLRDLVVSLSLDSGNFSQNMKAINGQMKEAEAEFRAAGGSSKEFENSLAGQQAKHDMLAKKVALQSKAVEQYAAAMQEAEAKLATNKQQHDKLVKSLDEEKAKYEELVKSKGKDSDEAKAQAEVIKKLEGQLQATDKALNKQAQAVTNASTAYNNAKGNLNALKDELNNTRNALDLVADKAISAGDKLSGVGKKMTVGITAPIVALGTASIAAFKEVDVGLDTIVTKTGATGETLDSLSESFEDVYGSMAVSAADTGVAIGEINTRFGATGKVLEDMSRAFIQYSKINGTDLNGSIDSIDSVMEKFGIDASRVNDVLGLMTKAGQDTGISVNQLTQLLQTNGATLKELGFSLEDSVSLMAMAEANGVEVTTMLTGLRRAAADAARDGKSVDSVLTTLYSSIKGAATETEAMEIAVETFGTKGAAEMVSAIREERITLDELNYAMGDYAGLVKQTYEATLDEPDKLTVVMNNLKLAGSQLAKTFMAQVGPALTSLVTGVQGLVERFGEMDEGTKERIIKLAALAAACGPVTTAVGKVTTGAGQLMKSMSNLGKSITAAGGGMKGLGTVLASSPAAWLAIAAAVGVAIYKLNDYVSGAKAAREALESLDKSLDSWTNHTAQTFYTESQGMSAFGMSADNFTRKVADSSTWLDDVLTEWSDTAVETDDTVSKYVDSFKLFTDETRTSLTALSETAKEAGYKDLYGQMELDLKELDNIDSRVEELLKKRKEHMLSDKDVEELNSLISRREDIEIKYHLSAADANGFDEIISNVNAEIEKAQARGEEVSSTVYEDALVAAGQGMAAINAALDEQYRDRYKLIASMSAEEQSKALEDLNNWYNAERNAAAQKYKETMQTVIAPVVEDSAFDEVYDKMGRLNALLATYSKENTTALASFVENELNEDEITEVYSILSQIQELVNTGIPLAEVLDGTGIDIEQYKTMWAQLEGIGETLAGLDTDENIGKLKGIFGDLSQEVITMATALNLEGAKADWAAFAEDPGADVFTDAFVQKYEDAPGVTCPPAAIDAFIKAYRDENAEDPSDVEINAFIKAYQLKHGSQEGTPGYSDAVPDVTANVDGYNAEGAQPLGDPEVSARVTDYDASGAGTVARPETDAKVTGYDASQAEPAGNPYVNAVVGGYERGTNLKAPAELTPYIEAVVEAYKPGTGDKAPDPKAVAASVAAYVEAYEFVNGKAPDASAVAAYVTGYISDYEPSERAKNYVLSVPTELKDYDERQIQRWKNVNGAKVKLDPVELPVDAALGDDWYSSIGTLAADGKLKLYDEKGVSLAVTPETVAQLTAEDLVVGVDQDGVYHVTVKPVWEGAGAEEAEKATEEFMKGDQDWLDKLLGYDTSLFSKLATAINDYQKAKSEYNPNSASKNKANMGLGLNLKNADTVVDKKTEQSLADYTLTLISAANAGEKLDEQTLANMESIKDFIGYIDYFNNASNLGDMGKNSNETFTNAVVSGLSQMGISVPASELSSWFKDLYETAMANAATDAQPAAAETGELIDQGVEEGITAHDWSRATSGAVKAIDQGMRSEAGISSPARKFIPIGEYIAMGIEQGIKNRESSAISTIKSFAQNLLNSAKSFLGIHSPSAVFRDEVGKMMMEGIGEGITQETPKQGEIIRNAARYLTDEAKQSLTVGGSTQKQYNYSNTDTISFEGATFYVRSDDDIRSLAQEIAGLTKRNLAGKGVR